MYLTLFFEYKELQIEIHIHFGRAIGITPGIRRILFQNQIWT
jgi:hypothetical protein